ncbi:uncharacterized protein si:ch211-171b20.3 isoform X1 [Osmerus eperlanus]|uniref:uncharacterized protein si:ch211-171b20.3 isoform X1 n=1 Tax=Osmerus eperlanus TaxID=29151 RepID=UPI002E0E93ED
MYSFTSPKLLTGGSLSTDGDKVFSEASLRCTLPGPLAAVDHSLSSTFGARSSMRIPAGRPPGVKPNNQSFRRKCLGIQDSSRNGKTLDYNCILEGSTFIGRAGTSLARLDSDNNGETPACGRHFLFDKKWKNDDMCPKYELKDERFLRSSGAIPPLPRDYQVHRSGNLNRYSCLKERSLGPSRPLTLGCYEGYDLTSGPAILLPSAISLTGRHSLSIDGCKHRPRVGNRTCSLFTIGAHQKSVLSVCLPAQTYPDPVSGASASFIQRLSEISYLEGETIRQEKIKKLKKSRKQDS